MRDYFYIGSCPAEEDCAQLGVTERFAELSRLECSQYVAALRVVYGFEPEGCRYQIKWEEHDFGSYPEVVIWYDDEDEASVEYAQKVEYGLGTWAEAGMKAPKLKELTDAKTD